MIDYCCHGIERKDCEQCSRAMTEAPHMNCPLSTKKCWEQYQGFYARVMTRDITLATDYLNLRTRMLAIQFTDEGLEKVEEAVYYLRDLVSRQWREMVREPFDFDQPKPLPTPIVRPKASIEDLA